MTDTAAITVVETNSNAVKGKSKGSKEGFKAFCKHFDFLGHPVQMNFQGDNTYKTVYGALLSICIVIFIGF